MNYSFSYGYPGYKISFTDSKGALATGIPDDKEGTTKGYFIHARIIGLRIGRKDKHLFLLLLTGIVQINNNYLDCMYSIPSYLIHCPSDELPFILK